MGDRALIRFHDTETIGPTVYLHWGGSTVRSLLDRTKAFMADRTGDVAYTTARCVGLAHSDTPKTSLSLGVWSEPSDNYLKERERMLRHKADPKGWHYPYSHGDAGVFLVNCLTWEVECFGGYGLGAGCTYGGEPTIVKLTEPVRARAEPPAGDGADPGNGPRGTEAAAELAHRQAQAQRLK